ncbi:hypothetical protein ACRTEC_16490 [Janibacter indicus]
MAVRQEARQAVLKAQAEMVAERKLRDKQLSALGVDVVVALRERDEAIARWEESAGRALRKMTDEGLSVKELLPWCGPEVTHREAVRLLKLSEEPAPVDVSEEDGKQEAPVDSSLDKLE